MKRYRDYARQASEKFDLRYEEIDGSPALVQKMIAGPWDDEFVVVSPGETITYEMFTSAIKCSREHAGLPLPG